MCDYDAGYYCKSSFLLSILCANPISSLCRQYIYNFQNFRSESIFHAQVMWDQCFLEPGLLPLHHSTILCEPRPQKHARACSPVCVCFYSLLLIFLIYICVELHGHNFKPIVWLWKPFHRCFVKVRRQWDSKASIVDVFATFLLLSYSKLLFVSLFLLQGTQIYNADGEHVPGTSHVLWIDATVRYLSEEHI